MSRNWCWTIELELASLHLQDEYIHFMDDV